MLSPDRSLAARRHGGAAGDWLVSEFRLCAPCLKRVSKDRRVVEAYQMGRQVHAIINLKNTSKAWPALDCIDRFPRSFFPSGLLSAENEHICAGKNVQN
jgi:hypothetical protein